MFDNLVADEVVPVVEAELVSLVETKLGVTPAQALAYLKESEEEQPGESKEAAIQDATGKFKHALRIGADSSPKAFGSIIDGAWPFIESFVLAVVTSVANQAA